MNSMAVPIPLTTYKDAQELEKGIRKLKNLTIKYEVMKDSSIVRSIAAGLEEYRHQEKAILHNLLVYLQ